MTGNQGRFSRKIFVISRYASARNFSSTREARGVAQFVELGVAAVVVDAPRAEAGATSSRRDRQASRSGSPTIFRVSRRTLFQERLERRTLDTSPSDLG